MTHNLVGLSIAFAILWMVFAIPANAQSYYDNSQGEGNYNGSNSQGAATYYHGGGQEAYPGYGDSQSGRDSSGAICNFNCD